MLNVESIVHVVDNTGAKTAKCIKILLPVTSKGYKTGRVGKLILVSVQKVLPEKKIKKGLKYKAIIVSVKQTIIRQIGNVKLNKNNIVLLNKNNEPLGTRLNSYIVKEVREAGFIKLISLAEGII